MSWINPDPRAANVEKRREFFHAVISDQNKAKVLIENDPSVLKLRDGCGETTLHYIAIENGTAEVKFLIEQGADVNTQDDFGHTPLMNVVGCGHLEMCHVLLEAGADVDLIDELNEKAIFKIGLLEKNVHPIIKLLIDHGANVNESDNVGNTPLHECVSFGNFPACKALLDLDADCMQKNDCGHIPFFAIHDNTPIELAILLIESGTDLNFVDSVGETLLHTSVFVQNVEITEYLLKLGLSPHIKQEFGDTAWNNARKEWRDREKLKIFEPYL